MATNLLDAVILKIQNNEAPGIDEIIGFWYKSLYPCSNELLLVFDKAFNGLLDIPDWLTTVLTRLLPKNGDTENLNIYRP